MAVYIGFCQIILVLFVSSFFSRWAAVAFIALVSSTFLPARLWPGFLSGSIFRHWRRYLHYSYLFEENLSPYNKYLCAQFPHGACSIGAILAGSVIQACWPEFNAHCVVASIIFRIPGWKHLHGWMASHPATKSNIDKLYQGKHNCSTWQHQPPTAATAAAAGLADPSGSKLSPSSSSSISYGDSTSSGYDSDNETDMSSSSGRSSRSSDSSSTTDAVVKVTARIITSSTPPAAVTATTTAAAAGSGAAFQHPDSTHLSPKPITSTQPTHDPTHLSLGVSVGILVGGIAEIFKLHPDKERIVLRNRRGFVRVAVEHGAYLIPVYYFGQSTFLSFGPKWLSELSRKLRMTIGFAYGPLGLPIPRRQDIFTVSGKPIPVQQMDPCDPGFEPYVESVHATFTTELEALYYRHRAEYGWADRPLVIT